VVYITKLDIVLAIVMTIHGAAVAITWTCNFYLSALEIYGEAHDTCTPELYHRYRMLYRNYWFIALSVIIVIVVWALKLPITSGLYGIQVRIRRPWRRPI
jgi:hypothetical protein